MVIFHHVCSVQLPPLSTSCPIDTTSMSFSIGSFTCEAANNGACISSTTSSSMAGASYSFFFSIFYKCLIINYLYNVWLNRHLCFPYLIFKIYIDNTIKFLHKPIERPIRPLDQLVPISFNQFRIIHILLVIIELRNL